jgi:hypothetical protein
MRSPSLDLSQHDALCRFDYSLLGATVFLGYFSIELATKEKGQ